MNIYVFVASLYRSLWSTFVRNVYSNKQALTYTLTHTNTHILFTNNPPADTNIYKFNPNLCNHVYSFNFTISFTPFYQFVSHPNVQQLLGKS